MWGPEGRQVPENQEGPPGGLRGECGLAYGGIESQKCAGILLPGTLDWLGPGEAASEGSSNSGP